MPDFDAPEVEFGTSGLRGLATGFTPRLVTAYVQGFLALIDQEQAARELYLGIDLRASSPAIAAYCAAAAAEAGYAVHYAGAVPTPALAAYALGRQCPAIMVTGSHIPADRNGMKFYRRDGEFKKNDEAPARAHANAALVKNAVCSEAELPRVEREIAHAYVDRYLAAFLPDALSGMKIGVDLHSAVGADLLVEILTGLGASCHPFNRAREFVAVDTEALDPEVLATAREAIIAHGLDAVVSTDGDGDRPVLIDADGRQVSGDAMCTLAARYLGISAIVTPLSSSTAVEKSDWFANVVRTRIGSPFVIAAMDELDAAAVAGFEANGGFLLGSALDLPGGQLPALPTRDAALPILAVLAEASAADVTVSELVSRLPARFVAADRIKGVEPARARELLDGLAGAPDIRAGLDRRLAEPVDIDLRDGVRLVLADGAIVHFRQSGNAPETRCYVETGAAETSARLLEEMMTSLSETLNSKAAAQ